MKELSYTMGVMPNSIIAIDGDCGNLLYYRRYAK